FVATQDIRFEAGAVGTGDKSGGLMPCFSPGGVKRLGGNNAAVPVSDKSVDTTCIYLPEKNPGAGGAFDFASMRLNISLPQAALLNSAR
ncbi:FimD/PapC N-terminal domain-containing protein, partial [Salmonella enterica]|uniref:FimD/PapC N-terminal domain-containing protein n=1 Tax=Salmonella enterica TaxID=28901 RepID=UPI000AE3D53F